MMTKKGKDVILINVWLEVYFGTGYITHKLEHDRFYNQILQSADKFKKNAESFNEGQLDRIKRWFFNHIEKFQFIE